MVDIPSDGHTWLPHNIVNRSPIVSFSYSITTDCHRIYQWHALKSVQSFVVPRWVSHSHETISVIKLKTTICSLNSAKNVQSLLNFLGGFNYVNNRWILRIQWHIPCGQVYIYIYTSIDGLYTQFDVNEVINHNLNKHIPVYQSHV